MKQLIFAIFLLISAATRGAAADTVRVADFGARADSYRNCTEQVQAAIAACRERNAKVLAFDCGRYDIWPEGAMRREYYISNTSSETECPSKIKTVGILFENIEGLTVEGNGATLIFHGKMIPVAFSGCRNVRLHNVHIDFERPGGSEMTYTRAGKGFAEADVHRDTRYEIRNGRMHLIGEGWRSDRNHCIEYHRADGHFCYSHGWDTLAASEATEVRPGTVRFATPEGFRPTIGNTLTIRDIIRDHVGMFINRCEDMTLDSVDIRYMHGLGIVGQYSRNLTYRRLRCAPAEGSGRLLASSADFMHFSGCRGKISVTDSHFEGAQDDHLNVHGTNLRITCKTGPRKVVVRFMHPQSYGFEAFFPGDTVAFVNARTMERAGSAVVDSARLVSPREIELVFSRDVPESLVVNRDCVENMTWTPEVEVRRCYFGRTSTRGLMPTTPRRVVIADNTFDRTGMCAVLIEGDARGWYESGPVNDVLIENNTFIDCAYNGGPANAVIATNPSVTAPDPARPVHRNIRIKGNRFVTHGNPLLCAKSTRDIVFQGNTLETGADIRGKKLFLLNGCSGVSISGNKLPAEVTAKSIGTANMSENDFRTDL